LVVGLISEFKLHQPPRPEEVALRASMGRRAELKDMLHAETCRLERPPADETRTLNE